MVKVRVGLQIGLKLGLQARVRLRVEERVGVGVTLHLETNLCYFQRVGEEDLTCPPSTACKKG